MINKNVIFVFYYAILLLFVITEVECVSVDDECYGTGSIVGAVFGTLIIVVLLLCAAYFLWNYYWKSRKGKHLVLETDVENVGDQFAFDNPCFKDGTIPAEKLSNKVDLSKTKWTHWSPLGALSSHKHDKRKTLDDSLVEAKRINLITLRSHDFTGLGFNVQGNMRDGIFIKDVLHRGPAFESGKVNSGDRIVSVRISFDHMVYEDALTILSYASPYEVQLELESSTRTVPKGTPNGSGVVHPIYKSGSSGDLTKIGKSVQQRLFHSKTEESEYPTLKLSSQPTTLERPVSVPPTNSTNNTLTKPERTKKAKTYSPSQLKMQLEQNLQQNDKKLNENLQKLHNDITTNNNIDATIQQHDETQLIITNEIENTKNKLQKYGVRVLPQQNDNNTPSPMHTERSQNENNINYEKYNDDFNKTILNDVETIVASVKETIDQSLANNEFNRENSFNNSGIKRDKAGIPQEIPDHMLQAANAARKNRKNSTENIIESNENGIDTTDSNVKINKKSKGKAPSPPSVKDTLELETETIDKPLNFTNNFEPISTETLQLPEKIITDIVETILEQPDKPIIFKETIQKSKSTGTIEAAIKSTVTDDLAISDHIVSGNCNFEYSSDSDADTDQNSVINNTIELNASDITIHHSSGNSESEGTDISNDSRKAASLGDLSKFETGRRSNTGTLERAQSLDITDSNSIPTLSKKRKAPNRPEDEVDLDNFNSDEFLYSNSLMKNKEPRLSLGTDNLTPTFQLNRLKKWGNLEDVLPLNEFNKSDFDKEKNQNSTIEETVKVENTVENDSSELLTTNLKTEECAVEEDIIIEPINNKPELLSDIPDSAYNSEPYSSLTFSIGETNNVDLQNNEESVEKNVQTFKITTNSDDTDKTNESEINTITFTPFSVTPLDDNKEKLESCLKNTSESLNEKYIENPTLTEKLSLNFTSKLYDTNVSDDIKVSRHSLGSLERPKSDVLKNVNKLKELQSLIQSDLGGVSNVIVSTDQGQTEITLPTNSELNVTSTTNGSYHESGGFKNITHFQINTDDTTSAELYTTAIDTSLEPTINNGTLIETTTTEDIVELNNNGVESSHVFNETPSELLIKSEIENNEKFPSFVTEIEVSPNNNVSEVTINNGITEISNENSPKKLPEMKFTTSSYENSRPIETTKRVSQIEMLRSNFENKNSIKSPTSPTKSKIPVAIHTKTSPDRPPSYVKGDDSGDEKEIIDIMSKTTVHSTPIQKHSIKNPVVKNLNNKNVTVTSIRTSSKIPSGHFTAGNFPSRPPIPPRRNDENTESTFQQWVFTPTDTTKYSSNVTEKKSE